MSKLATLIFLVIVSTVMMGCNNLGDTVDIGVIHSWGYAGNCQTTVILEDYKFNVEGMHTFKPGSRAEIITYEMNNSKSLMILFLPDTHQRALITSTAEEVWGAE